MKTKTLIILLCIFGALLFFGLAKKVVVRHEEVATNKEKEVLATAVLVSGLKPEFVDKIIFYKGSEPDKKIIFDKGGSDRWYVASRYFVRANKSQVDALLKTLMDLKGEVRGTSQAVFDDFKISEVDGLHLILQNDSGKDIVHLVVGMKMSSMGGNFVRRADSDKTALITDTILSRVGIYSSVLGQSPNDNIFVDYRLVADVDPRKAGKIEFIYPKSADSFILVKVPAAKEGEKPFWCFEPPLVNKQIDPAKVDEFLRILTEISGRDAVDPKGQGYGLEPPQVRVKATVGETTDMPQEIELDLGGVVPPKGMYYVRVLPREVVYTVPENAALNLRQGRAYFLQNSKSQPQNKSRQALPRDKAAVRK